MCSKSWPLCCLFFFLVLVLPGLWPSLILLESQMVRPLRWGGHQEWGNDCSWNLRVPDFQIPKWRSRLLHQKCDFFSRMCFVCLWLPLAHEFWPILSYIPLFLFKSKLLKSRNKRFVLDFLYLPKTQGSKRTFLHLLQRSSRSTWLALISPMNLYMLF